jgi:ABC-type sugar transport system ATPase subunit
MHMISVIGRNASRRDADDTQGRREVAVPLHHTQEPAGTTPQPGVETPVLRVQHLSKTFPGTKALDDVSLEIAEGEIHALVGQNGSGKSTLIKVLAGYHRADPGSQVWLNDEAFDVADTSNASHQRLRFVHQDLGLFLELNATDNLALRGEFLLDPVHRVRWKAQAELTRELLGRFDVDIDVSRPLSEATPVQRTIVAIAAALAGWEGGPGLLVLDEPTAVLPPHDVERLMEIVERVRSRGTSILYVSHRLDEVFRLADRVTVLRGGRVVATRPTEGLNSQLLAELMVGAGVDASFRADVPGGTTGPVVLRARDIRGRFLDGVDVELREGEILGIAGLPGSGRNELPYAIAGAMKDATGHLELDGCAPIPVRKAQSLDIPIVPADRAREASLAEFSVAENISVSVLSRVSRNGVVRRAAERKLIDKWMKTIEVTPGSERNPISTLSGGNQQKVIMARCLARDPRVLVLCEPTAGVDVGTRQAIYEFVAERAKAGLSLLVSSSDTGDLLAICTRVLVMCNGRVVRELTGAQITEQALLHAMEETEQV